MANGEFLRDPDFWRDWLEGMRKDPLAILKPEGGLQPYLMDAAFYGVAAVLIIVGLVGLLK